MYLRSLVWIVVASNVPWLGQRHLLPVHNDLPKKVVVPFRPVTIVSFLMPSCARWTVTSPVAELKMPEF